MMRLKWIVCVMMVLAGVECLGAGGVQIKAVKKTKEVEKGSVQELPRGTTRAVKKDVFIRFSVRRVDATLPDTVDGYWFIAVEQANGRTLLAKSGQKKIQIPLGQWTDLDTETVTILSREWKGPHRDGEIASEIKDYALILKDGGDVVSEEYSSSDMKEMVAEQGAASPSKTARPFSDDRRFFRKPLK